MAWIPSLLISACWLIFLGYWIASARGVKPVAERTNLSLALRYRLPLLSGCLLLWIPKSLFPLDINLTQRSTAAQSIAAAICLLGLLFTIWARRTLAGNWSSAVTFKQDHELIKTGPYQFVRHPIYTGILTMCLGSVIVEGRLHCWLGLALFFVAFWVKLRQEEVLMLQHFPGEYPSYKSRVKALIPFVL
ncbi:MAG TPA: isoprenylcysteine carboxylmethyltransferase family protein [Verrucomicrobiae bacterium]|jgi:protein-S-isoprenylcysteine O-methyltransferase Ste14